MARRDDQIEQSQSEPALPTFDTLPNVILNLFEGAASPRARGLSDAMTLSFAHAVIDPRGKEVIIDKEAILRGITDAGNFTQKYRDSSNWLVDWIRTQKFNYAKAATKRGKSASEKLTAVREGYRLDLSYSMKAPVVPRAVDLAMGSVRRAQFDLRHLLVALTEYDEGEWAFLEPRPTPAQMASLRTALITDIIANPEPGENVAFWKSLIASSESSETGAASTPTLRERLSGHQDEPAEVDLLDRRPFAKAIATRFESAAEEARKKTGARDAFRDNAYMMHLHGPWGAGKSSILRFVGRELPQNDWIVVHFNAWLKQGQRPAWWGLVNEVSKHLRWKTHWVPRLSLVWFEWMWWSLRTRWVPVLLILLIAAIILSSVPEPGASGVVGQSLLSHLVPGVVAEFFSGSPIIASIRKFLGSDLVEFSKVVTAVLALYVLFRNLTLGSEDRAKAIASLNDSPFKPVIGHFERMILWSRKNVLICIDDLDRCDRDYVVELLENIQTMLRTVPISYLVAADRNWITASFEQKYKEFAHLAEGDARPLGHMFLDKIFQVSTSIPNMTPHLRERFWRRLLSEEMREAHSPEQKQAAETKANHLVKGKTTVEELQAVIDSAESHAEKGALLVAAAKQISSPEARAADEHRFTKFATLLEANPRSMKRLVNTLGMRQAQLLIEGRASDADMLARWTIIEMRWPVMAQHILEQIETAEYGPDITVDECFAKNFGCTAARRLFDSADDQPRLDVAALKELMGEVEERDPKL